MSKWVIVLLVCCLLCAFLICSAASYLGFGVRQIGERYLSAGDTSVRSGSTAGPRVTGGGPSSGK